MEQALGMRSAGVITMPGVPKSLRPENVHHLDEVTDLAPGTELFHTTRYEVVERIGEGGMGKVYKAYDAVMDRYVALKILKLDVPEPFHRRFRREAQISANFSHPNLVRVLDIGAMPDRGLEWMAMEHLRGRDLGMVIDKGREIALPLLIDIFRQTLDGLHYVHTRRIVHCDVKPDNIFITRDFYNPRLVIVKLIDFGICRGMDPTFEPESTISGDPRYMAPEQQVLNGPVDGRADIYALGITFYESVTGRHPYQPWLEHGVDELLTAHREHQGDRPSAHLGDLPRSLRNRVDELFLRATAKNPDDRWPDAMAMKAAFEKLLAAAS